MNHQHNPISKPGQENKPLFWRSRYGLGLLVFGVAATYFLVTEHRAHFFGALPFLLLLACPVMHIFMHGGHGRHGADDDRPGGNQAPEPSVSKTGEQP